MDISLVDLAHSRVSWEESLGETVWIRLACGGGKACMTPVVRGSRLYKNGEGKLATAMHMVLGAF